MPVMNGLEFCKRVKSNVATSHIPLILLTAKDSEKSIIKGLTCKADHILLSHLMKKYSKLTSKTLLIQERKLNLNF
ncbi:MAG: hypothetical protein CM15mP32_4450 [Flavobacteriaceae bacterium]|nr:MAG: hypothetical protein CM15mP32_4450 [Flavobacteriaceae bacterium]